MDHGVTLRPSPAMRHPHASSRDRRTSGPMEAPAVCQPRPGEADRRPRDGREGRVCGTLTSSGHSWDERSGWSDSNRRNLPSPKRALYQAELHPACTLQRTYSVTRRADELAFRHLRARKAHLPRVEQPAHVIHLLRARQVIPVHRDVGGATAAVGARRRLLEASVPAAELRLTGSPLLPVERAAFVAGTPRRTHDDMACTTPGGCGRDDGSRRWAARCRSVHTS